MRQVIWLFILFGFLSFPGCYDKKEGCLDTVATNFDVAADKDCCCEYPSVVLKMTYKVDEASFSTQKYYQDIAGHVYRVLGFAYYLSHLEVEDDNNTWYDLRDSTSMWVYGVTPSEVQVSDNVFVVKQNKTKYDFATIKHPAKYNQVKWTVGIDAIQNTVIPDSLSGNNSLGFKPDSLWAGPSSYIQQQWIVVTDTTEANYTVDTFQVLGAGGDELLSFVGGYDLPQGVDFELNIAVDMKQWFNTIDWRADKLDVLQKLRINSLSAFSLVQ